MHARTNMVAIDPLSHTCRVFTAPSTQVVAVLSDLTTYLDWLIGDDESLGTAQLHQQLVFRSVVGLARTETAISGLSPASTGRLGRSG